MWDARLYRCCLVVEHISAVIYVSASYMFHYVPNLDHIRGSAVAKWGLYLGLQIMASHLLHDNEI
jgi:hypothetical protein